MATLYALERYYALQAAAGLDVSRWRPAPRQRPDQFLAWTRSCLDALNTPAAPETLLAALSEQKLSHVAAVLSHSLERREQPTDDQATSELHPQVRKFAHVIAREMDPLWLAALRALPAPRTPEDAVAMSLGGLPLGLETIVALLEKTLVTHDAALLSPLQLFGLATGITPSPHLCWRIPPNMLEGLSAQDLACLSSLSNEQYRRLRELDDSTLQLIRLRESLGCSDERWQNFGHILLGLSRGEVAQLGKFKLTRTAHLPASQRHAAQGVAYLLAYWPASPAVLMTFKDALTDVAWQRANLVSPELRRQLVRGKFHPKLLAAVRRWSPSDSERLRRVCADEPILLWRQDTEMLEELSRGRSNAWLEIKQLFPESTLHLAQYLGGHVPEALMTDLAAIMSTALSIEQCLGKTVLPVNMRREVRDRHSSIPVTEASARQIRPGTLMAVQKCEDLS